MSVYDYDLSKDIAENTTSTFPAAIMAAILLAPSVTDAAALQQAFPVIWDEMVLRHTTPGGVLAADFGPH